MPSPANSLSALLVRSNGTSPLLLTLFLHGSLLFPKKRKTTYQGASAPTTTILHIIFRIFVAGNVCESLNGKTSLVHHLDYTAYQNDMKYLELAFHLGVVFAIFGFLWGIVNLLLSLFRMGRKKTIGETYLLKFVQYFFLVDVTFLFCVESETANFVMLNELVAAALILIIYFSGKLQNKQRQNQFFQMTSMNGMPKNLFEQTFNLRAEIVVIVASMAIFSLFFIEPSWARNPVSVWFYESILDIEDTPVFGFIFKVIGFFVLLSMLVKLANGFSYLLSGGPLVSVESRMNMRNKKKDDDFDDFEELS